MLKRIISILLLLVMICGLISCDLLDDDEEETSDLAETQSTETETKTKEEETTRSSSKKEEKPKEEIQVPAPPDVELDVPGIGEDGFMGFGGKEIVILQRQIYEDEFYSERENGVLLNDAVYKRNQYVQEYLNVQLGWAVSVGGEASAQKEKLLTAVQNGEEVYHISANVAAYAVEWIGDGCFWDLNAIPENYNYLSPTKAWWNQSYNKESTVYGKQFFMVGDATTTAITKLEVLAVNEPLLKEYVGLDINDLLNKVYNRTWTYETFLTYVESVDHPDIYGASLQCNATSVDGFLNALAVPIVEKNQNGGLSLAYDSQKTESIANALRELYQNNEHVYSDPTHMYDQKFVRKFTENKAIFYAGLLSDAADHFKTVSFRYAVMPMPIWDANQAEYRITPHDEYSVLGIPRNVTSMRETTAVMEVMAAESYRSLRPVLCEKTYQYRYLVTPEKAQMFYYMIDHAYYDCGYIYSIAFNGPLQWVLRWYVVYDANSEDKYIGDLDTEIGASWENNNISLRELLLDIANAR